MLECVYRGVMLSLFLLVCGCGSPPGEEKMPVVAARGTVTIPDMETSGLSLLFLPETETNPNAWTKLDSEGQFIMSTYDAGDGAVVGKYKVIVSGGEGPMEEDDPRMAKIPAEFKNRNRTPWEVEVTSDPDQNHFTLTTK